MDHKNSDLSLLLNDKAHVILKSIKEALIRETFIGEYRERRHVSVLNAYRDVIIVNSNNKKTIQYLLDLQKFSEKYLIKNKWIGVTNKVIENESTTMIWLNLESEIPFGTYWIKFKNITFEDGEIKLSVKMKPYFQKEYTMKDIFEESTKEIRNAISFDNACDAARFCFILFMTIFIFIINSIEFIANYSIKFIYAFANLLEVLTPWFLGSLEFAAKCVASFYWLILMLFKGGAPSQRPIPILTRNSPRSIEYNHRNDKRNARNIYYYR